MNKNYLKVGIVALFCIIAFSVFYFKLYQMANIHFWMSTHDTLMMWTQKDYLVAIIIYCVGFSILLGFYMPFFDFSIILSGFLFGFDGIIYSAIIVVVGSAILYGIGRTFLKNWADRVFSKSPKLFSLAKNIRTQENFSVFILRFLPLFPFQIITFLCAGIGIKKKDFLLFSLLGYLPRMAIYVYIGIKLEQFFSMGENSANIWQAIPIKSILLILLLLGIFMLIGYLYMKKSGKEKVKR